MRELITLKDSQQARHLASYLAVQGIQASAEEDEGEWVIWYHSDDDRDQANEILTEFQKNPGDPKYEAAERKVRSVFLEANRLQKQIHEKEDRLRKRWSGSWWHCYPATYILIWLSVLVSVFCTDWAALKAGFGGQQPVMLGPLFCNDNESVLLSKLRMQEMEFFLEDGQEMVRYIPMPEFPERENLSVTSVLAACQEKSMTVWEVMKMGVSKGEFWRPVTPAFIHFSFLHIVFNMMWLRAMGTAIEFVRGTSRFLLLCLVLAVTSNVAQLFWSGPFFGGMSGVVFGLIGYVWMKGKTQPRLGIGLTHNTVVMSILWLVMCMAGVLGNIANAAHLVGFVGGILIGARQAIWKKMPFTK